MLSHVMGSKTPRWFYVFGGAFTVVMIALALVQHFVFGVGGHGK